MGRDAERSTTQPSPSTGQDPGRTGVMHIRWIFPSTVVTPPVTAPHVVGREDSCDTTLAGTEISRRHAELRIDGPLLVIRDLKSRNGVQVNGRKRVEAPLALGDVVRCGEWVGIVVADDDAGGLKEIAPGWFGGATLTAATEPARRLAADLPIIVEGETGTGKEGMARAIHGWSKRRGSFIAVNCAALPAHMAEAELFGYRKGAFTGAERASPGFFRAADGGTIFLDEILELPLEIQPKLLRVLEQREVQPLGETRPVAVDVRVVAATQESLTAAVADRRFRADLHARLDGLTVVLPPLRERRQDIVPLFSEFLRQHGGGPPPTLEAKLVEAIAVYNWPLNVRELLLLARRLLSVNGHEKVLKKLHLPDRMIPRGPDTENPNRAPIKSGRRRWRKTDNTGEFEAFVEALGSHNSVAKAAEVIGISRARAYRLLAAHPEFSLDGESGGQG